jgi:hypothetical protein
MTTTEIMVKMALQSWNVQIKRLSDFINSLPDDQFTRQIAPGKNRVIYLVGHLVAIHDAMNPLLGTGERSYGLLDLPFVQNPDDSSIELPSVPQLREYWNNLHQQLQTAFENMTVEEWFERHRNMTEEDFTTTLPVTN